MSLLMKEQKIPNIKWSFVKKYVEKQNYFELF